MAKKMLLTFVRYIGLPAVVLVALTVGGGLASGTGAAGSSGAYGSTIFALLTQPQFDPFGPPPESAVEVIDGSTMTKLQTLPLGQRKVTSLAVSPDESRLYVADQNAGIVIYDTATGFIVDTVALSFPSDTVISADGSHLYATTSSSIVAIDTNTRTVSETYSTGSDQPLGIALSADGAALAAVSTNGGSNPAMFLMDPGNLAGALRIPLSNPGEPTNCGLLPADVAFTNTGRALLWDDSCDNLYQVDVPGHSQLTSATIRMGRDSSAYYSRNSLSYSTASSRSYALTPDSGLAVMDPVAVSGSFLGGFSGSPLPAALAPNGKSLFVSVIHGGSANTLDQLATATGTFTRDVYTFSLSDEYVVDMHVVGPAVLTQGDVDCNGSVSSVDALKLLRHAAGLSVGQAEPCPDIGTLTPIFGDVDCAGGVSSVDALKLLRYNVALSVSQSEPCTNIGTQFP